jgi:RNA polymerase sigma-70 factor (ECF subfamily)
MNAKNEEGLFLIMSRYYNELFRYGIKFTANADTTRGCLNQFFIDIWDNREKLEKADNPKAYLFVAYKRWLLNWLQSQRKNSLLYLSESLENNLGEKSYEDYLVESIRNEELAQALRNAIEELPPRQKQLLQLRFYEHLSYEEISQKTLLSTRTVYNKLHEAIKKLRSGKKLAWLREKINT